MEKCNIPSHLLLFTICFFVLLLSVAGPAAAAEAHNISAVFAFGDSTLDPGNNNNLPTFVKANHPPYGRDFPGGAATGRFTDGKLITDFLVASLGLGDALPPYYGGSNNFSSAGPGVSFASAGSGLDDLTAATSGVETVATQVANFEAYIATLPAETAAEVVKDAMFIVGTGSNDLIMNYYLLPTRRSTFTLPSYHAFLLQKLESLIEQLYKLGARKFAVAGLPPLGCLPLQMTLTMQPNPGYAQRACIAEQNAAAAMYNADLQTMLQSLKTSPVMPDRTKFVYVDIFTPFLDMVQQPMKYGLIETRIGCCGTGLVEMGPLCNNPSMTCPFPSRFLFWDSVHPSQATYQSLANQFMQTVLPQFAN
ncbi:GDSL esterase/lipase At2g40250-like [Ananas comosus]|uniref:GDSL esterase/lipase At2g40250-like n=1 Tax=Ananas comosus TaxID=4615 RepID=A0A6P5H2K0_ANACO|nr:GDSL esterase/lipase At2g40250-like [Ananas comosus]